MDKQKLPNQGAASSAATVIFSEGTNECITIAPVMESCTCRGRSATSGTLVLHAAPPGTAARRVDINDPMKDRENKKKLKDKAELHFIHRPQRADHHLEGIKHF